jgi:HEAT repeat protein
MPVSYAELRAMLDVDEPDYAALVDIASGAMNHLRKLAASTDVSVASKAVSLAGFIGDADSIAVVENAARSRQPLVRVAAAHAASLVPDSPRAVRVVSRLLDDPDLGVVKTAMRAAALQTDRGLAVKARRASARLAAAVRAAARENTRRERATAMAMKARKKSGGGAARTKAGRKVAKGQMPTGAMTEPAKGAKARAMPAGKMN